MPKMDFRSMANIAGYRAVIEAGNNFGRFLLANYMLEKSHRLRFL